MATMANDELTQLLAMILERMRGFSRASLSRELSSETLVNLARTMSERITLNHKSSYQRYQEIAQVKGNPLIACRMGCAWCCHQTVAVTVPEAALVAHYVASTYGENDLRNLLLRLQDHRSARRAWLTDGNGSAFVKACPFLIDSACSIHELRPAACRGQNSFREEQCRHNYEHPEDVKELDCFFLHILIVNQIRWGLQDALTESGLEGGLYEFAGLVSSLLEDPSLLERYLQGGNPFVEHRLGEAETGLRDG